MTKYISILRGINVSGQKSIQMTRLKSLFEELGYKDVVTYIQSGNVVFKSSDLNKNIAVKIEKAIFSEFGFDVPVIVITPDELNSILEENPFAKETDFDASKLYFTILEQKPGSANVDILKSYNFEPDRIVIHDNVVYVYAVGGYGKTKFSNNFIENKLKVKATTRNWKTLNKLKELSIG